MPRVELDPGLRQAAQAGTPVEVVDSATGAAYYLISADQYAKIHSALSGDFDPREAYPLVDQIMAEDDQHDPLLDRYQ